MKLFTACLLCCSTSNPCRVHGLSEEVVRDGSRSFPSRQNVSHNVMNSIYSGPLRGSELAATESAPGQTSERLITTPGPQFLQLGPRSADSLRDSLIIASSPSCISVVTLSGKMLQQNPQSIAYYGDHRSGTSIQRSPEPLLMGVIAGPWEGVTSVGGNSSLPSADSGADVLAQLFSLDQEKEASMRQAFCNFSASGGRPGVWKAVVRVPYSLNTNTFQAPPLPATDPANTSPVAQQAPAVDPARPAGIKDRLPTRRLQVGDDHIQSQSQPQARVPGQMWTAASQPRTQTTVRPSTPDPTLGMAYSLGPGRCISQTDERHIGDTCSGSVPVVTMSPTGIVAATGSADHPVKCESCTRSLVSETDDVLDLNDEGQDGVSIRIQSQKGKAGGDVEGNPSGLLLPYPRRLAAPLSQHRPCHPHVPMSQAHYRPTLSTSINMGLTSGCSVQDPLATSTFSTFTTVSLAATSSPRPSSQILPIHRTAPGPSTSGRIAHCRVSIDDPLYPFNHGAYIGKGMSPVTAFRDGCTDDLMRPCSSSSRWGMPRKTVSFCLRETLCEQLPQRGTGAGLRAASIERWCAASEPQSSKVSQQLPRSGPASAVAVAVAQQQQTFSKPLQKLLQPPQRSPPVSASRALVFAMSLGTSPLATQIARQSSISTPQTSTSGSIALQQKHKHGQEQEGESQQLQQQRQQHSLSGLPRCDVAKEGAISAKLAARKGLATGNLQKGESSMSLGRTAAVPSVADVATGGAGLGAADADGDGNGDGGDAFHVMYMCASDQEHNFLVSQEPENDQQLWCGPPLTEENATSDLQPLTLDYGIPQSSASAIRRQPTPNGRAKASITSLGRISSNGAPASVATTAPAAATATAAVAVFPPSAPVIRQKRRATPALLPSAAARPTGVAGPCSIAADVPLESGRTHHYHHLQQEDPVALVLNVPQSDPGCWHEVWVLRAIDPVTGEDVMVLKQTDVTAKVVAERHLALVMETEHRLVEQLFPRHILEHITEDWTAAAAVKARQDLGRMQAADAGSVTLRRQSLRGQQQHKSPWSQGHWLPVIRDCATLTTSHSEVTLLFADIKGFTPMCKELEPRQTMTLLNELYSRYDDLLDKYGVYKVETIGDCYFVAGGLILEDEDGMAAVCDRSSREDPQHAERVLAFAKAMLVAARQVQMPTNGQPVEIRVGLHTGPVVSGVVGTRMPRFCLFGDTVNTASRMESTGVPGAIHASEATFRRLPQIEQAGWRSTGGIQVKGKGPMQTYLWTQAKDGLTDRKTDNPMLA